MLLIEFTEVYLKYLACHQAIFTRSSSLNRTSKEAIAGNDDLSKWRRINSFVIHSRDYSSFHHIAGKFRLDLDHATIILFVP